MDLSLLGEGGGRETVTNTEFSKSYWLQSPPRPGQVWQMALGDRRIERVKVILFADFSIPFWSLIFYTHMKQIHWANV